MSPVLVDDARAGAFTKPPSRPRVYTRSEWRADPPKHKADVLERAPDRLVVHHTATPNTADRGLDAAFALSRAIQRYHMGHNRWDDIGEQFTVSRGGHIMEGRNRTLPAVAEGRLVQGAQAANHNGHTLGIETEGTYMTELPPSVQLASLTDLLTWLCHAYRLNPYEAIIGHRDLNSTSCPGDRLYAYLPLLRASVARRLHVSPPAREPASRAMRLGRPGRRSPGPPPGEPLVPFEHGPATGPRDRRRAGK
ncbi:N-acetylmuramoyl-L-alanine amidase [Microbispora sp. RL4-1S]|uniref:N-acetylmuramoyl-L-alanine amidase n=2 Tax=Microbispora oryzae TaxID=2806554 RepID=A0A940WFC2_9ACTN|nr:N-acetylmuramoyl-L-alanine amidase [Microbispora oryzae]